MLKHWGVRAATLGISGLAAVGLAATPALAVGNIGYGSQGTAVRCVQQGVN